MRLIVDEEKVRNVFAKMKDETGFEESRVIFEKGKLPVEMLQALSLRPEILKAFGMMGKGVYPGGLIERNLKEKVILKASRLNNCQFCVVQLVKGHPFIFPFKSIIVPSNLSCVFVPTYSICLVQF